MKSTSLIILALLFSGLMAFGQDSPGTNRFGVSLQFRPRFEYRNGGYRPLSGAEDPAFLISSRLRLGMFYSHSDILKTEFTFQQVSLWGQAAPVQSFGQQNNNIGIFEGWVDLKVYKGIRMKIGRQTIKLDDQRLFSESDWSQGGRAHDALSVYYSAPRWDIRTYFAFNQNYAALYQGNLNNPSGNFYNSDGAQDYKYMQTLWLSRDLSPTSKVSFLLVNLGYQQVHMNVPEPDTRVAQLQTVGGRYGFSAIRVQFNLSGYYQLGRNALYQNVSAYLLSAGINGQIAPALNCGLRSDYLSGNNRNIPKTASHAFSTLFGTGHLFYGQMDYYPYSDAGLWNQVVFVNCHVSGKIMLNAEGHCFFAGHTFERKGMIYQKNLGQEADLNFIYSLNSFTGVSAGYSVYFSNKNIEALKSVSQAKSWQDWFWVSLNISPELFRARF